MADNLGFSEGVGKQIRSTESAGGAHIQHLRLDIGSGSTEGQITAGQKTSAQSLPVTLANDVTPEVSIREMIVALRTIFNSICNPSWLDKSSNRLRGTTLIESGTVTTVTGVTNLDGYQAKLPVINNNTAAWAQVVRARIS